MTQPVNTQVTTSPPGSTDPGSGTSSTDIPLPQLASEITATIQGGIARVPGLLIAHPVMAKYLRVRQSFYQPDLINSAATAVESEANLQAVPTLDPATSKKRLEYIVAFSALEEAMARGLENVRFTLASMKWDATLTALQTYEIAKSLVRDPKSTLAAHVTSMAKVVKRRLRKAAAVPAPPTTPTTPTTPASHTVPQLPQATAQTAA
jgi:hypothetical protein